MKAFNLAAVAGTVLSCLCFGLASLCAGPVNNTAHWLDTSGNHVKAQGGNITKSGSYYYLVGVDFNGGSATGYSSYNGVHIYRSQDLATWEYRSSPIYPGIAGLGFPATISQASAWVGRPTLIKNSTTNRWVLIFESQLGVAYAITAAGGGIEGPYYYGGLYAVPAGTQPNDISVFQDGANAYIVANLDKNAVRKMGIMKLSPADFYTIQQAVVYKDTTGGYREAPHIFKRGSRYYWFASGLNWWYSTKTSYRTSTSLSGGWSGWADLATTPAGSSDSFGTQHDFVVRVGTTDTFVYFGDTYSQFTGMGGRYNAAYPLWFDTSATPKPFLIYSPNWSVNTTTGAITYN